MVEEKKLFTRRLNCPICKSSDLSVLFNVPMDSPGFFDFLKLEKFYSEAFFKAYYNGLLHDVVFEIIKCKNCGFVFQSEVLNDTGMSLLYNEWLDQNLLLKHYSTTKPDITQYNLLTLIKKFNKHKRVVSVMDFGAGYGNFCVLSSKLGLNTYAFDLSNDKNDHLSSKLGVKIIANLDHFQSFFDFIYINQVIEHLSSPTEILRKLRNCLSSNGIILISVPDCQNISGTIKKHGLSNELFLQLSPHQHINAFNNKTLKLLGQESGLKAFNVIDHLKFFKYPLTLSEGKFILKESIKSSIGIGTSLFFRKNK